jgi:hypothetical protein
MDALMKRWAVFSRVVAVIVFVILAVVLLSVVIGVGEHERHPGDRHRSISNLGTVTVGRSNEFAAMLGALGFYAAYVYYRIITVRLPPVSEPHWWKRKLGIVSMLVPVIEIVFIITFATDTTNHYWGEYITAYTAVVAPLLYIDSLSPREWFRARPDLTEDEPPPHAHALGLAAAGGIAVFQTCVGALSTREAERPHYWVAVLCFASYIYAAIAAFYVHYIAVKVQQAVERTPKAIPNSTPLIKL